MMDSKILICDDAPYMRMIIRDILLKERIYKFIRSGKWKSSYRKIQRNKSRYNTIGYYYAYNGWNRSIKKYKTI